MYNRQNNLILGSPSVPYGWASAHFVNVYQVGAVVKTSSINGENTVVYTEGPHEFKQNDKALQWRAGGSGIYVNSRVVTVSYVDPSIMFAGRFSFAPGDRLVCLGPDSGTSSPSWDGSSRAIYRDPSADSAVRFGNSRVTTDGYGNYAYYVQDLPCWELVRGPDGLPVSLIEGNGYSNGFDETRFTGDLDMVDPTLNETIGFSTSDPNDDRTFYLNYYDGVVYFNHVGRVVARATFAGNTDTDSAVFQWLFNGVLVGSPSTDQGLSPLFVDVTCGDTLAIQIVSKVGAPTVLADGTSMTIKSAR